VSAVPEYRPEALHGTRVLFTRLAVSDEFEDARTGVMLSSTTRTLAARDACTTLAMEWSEGGLVCIVVGASVAIPELLELERSFALNQSIPLRVWGAIRKQFKADCALLVS
jgi:hypothetical protein